MGKGFVTSAKENSFPCHKCQKTPKAGDTLYMQNLGTEEAKNWISCIDQVCFESQGGDKGLVKGQKKAKFYRTTEQRNHDADEMLNILWPKCYDYAVEFYKAMKWSGASNQDILIFAEVLYKGAAIDWARS